MSKIFVSIRHTVYLGVQLIDGAIRNVIEDAPTKFLYDDKPIGAIRKSNGMFAFTQCPSESFWLTVNTYGYTPKTIYIDFEVLGKSPPPILLVHLTPGKYYRGDIPCYSLVGTCPEITYVEAVRKGETLCRIKEFDERKRILTVFNPHNLQMDQLFYGLINTEKNTYEPFEIIKKISETQYKLKSPLKESFKVDSPIAGMFFGTTDKVGNYTIKMRNDNSDGKYIVRYIKSETDCFKLIDFNNAETMCL